MTKTARITAIAAFTLACAAASPAAWATGPKDDHRSKASSSASHAERGSEPAGGTGGDHNPPGNNGSVKIHQVAGDTSPHNVPHVTCDFFITFFGFDANQTADLTLRGQAPTGKDTELWSQNDVLISTDDAGGGKDVDNEIHVTAADLGLDRLGSPHPKQGYHLTLDVNVAGAPGGAKHKVFWVEPCQSTAAVSGVTAGVQGNAVQGSAVQGGNVSGVGATAGGPQSQQSAVGAEVAKPGAQVLGVQYTRDTAGREAPLGSSLPFTGAPLAGLAAAAVLSAGAGAVLLQAGRRRHGEL